MVDWVRLVSLLHSLVQGRCKLIPSAMLYNSIITYVLLCGYSPFRSEDPVELVKETTEAKVKFHERYWKNISQEGMCLIEA